MVNKFDKEEKIKIPEKNSLDIDKPIEFSKEEVKDIQEKSISEEEKIIADKLRQEIEMMETDESLTEEAKNKASKIKFLGQEEKISHLLKIASEKGLVFAVKMAKEMRDPYLLDILHDILAKEGYYQKFTK